MGADVASGLQQVVSHKRVLVIHPCTHIIGGAEMVLVKVLEVLVECGCDVSLLGVLPCGSIFDGLPLSNIKQISCESELVSELNFKPKRFRAYRELFHNLKLSGIFRKKIVGKFDLEINTSGFLKYSIGIGKKRVVYTQVFPKVVPRLQKSDLKHRWFWTLYYLPITLQFKWQVKKTDLLICNSCYIQNATKTHWWGAKTTELVYPPVDIEDFKPLDKEFLVVSVCRISPEKNLELVVEVARRMPDVKFVIAGRRHADFYFDRIVALKPDNVELVVDASRGELSVLLGRAKVYLHCMVGEAFGISVGEAMAAGCVPVVHDSGGPVEVVGGFGFVYDGVDECVKAIRGALQSETSPSDIAERARMFSSDNFKKNFVDVLEKNGFL